MMRRIDRELDLPAHIAKKIKEKFKQIFSSVEKLDQEKEEIKRVIRDLEDSSAQMREYLEKLRTGEIPSIEDRIKNLENDHQTIKDGLETISDAILQLNQKITKIEDFLNEFGYE